MRQSWLALCRDREFPNATGPWGSWASIGSRPEFLGRDRSALMGEAKACRNKGWPILGRDLGFWVVTKAGWLGGVATSARPVCSDRAPSKRS